MSNKAATLVPPALIQSTTTKLKAILEEWRPYVVPLTDAEKEGMAKMKDRSLPFAIKAKEYAVADPEYVPAFMDPAAFAVDMDNVQGVTPVYAAVQQLAAALNDLLLVSNSEAYEAALLYYSSVKLAARQGAPEAKAIADDLGVRFPGRRPKPVEPA